jgi:hypothetical protein
MNPFLLDETTRFLAWRDLRKSISTQTDEEKLLSVASWWANAPLCNYVIDAFDCSKWPTPWELLKDNVFCSTSIAYMMSQTLVLSGFDSNRIKIAFIRSNNDELMAVIVDDSYILNYSLREVYDWNAICEDYHILQAYGFNDKQQIVSI